LGYLAYQIPQLHALRFAFRLDAREGQEPPYGLSTIDRGLRDNREGFAERFRVDGGLFQGTLRKVAVAGNEPKRLIQIVGDAACHLTQSTHLLRLREGLALVLGLLALGDVHFRAQQPRRPTGGIAEDASAVGEPSDSAVGPNNAVLYVQIVALLDSFRHRGGDQAPIVGVHALQERARVAL
jgi:hypothetical protein